MGIISSKKHGFTLLELILVTALLVITSAIVAPIYFSAKGSDDLNNSVSALVSSLRRAQSLSMAIEGDSSWGVKIINDNFTIFKGSDYFSRDSLSDENFKINKNIKNAGLDEIVFSKLDGRPNLTGDIVLNNNNTNKILNINSLGIIDY
jgi:prepilin-type N-terminal cleavage/methylation domain-containing protein